MAPPARKGSATMILMPCTTARAGPAARTTEAEAAMAAWAAAWEDSAEAWADSAADSEGAWAASGIDNIAPRKLRRGQPEILASSPQQEFLAVHKCPEHVFPGFAAIGAAADVAQELRRFRSGRRAAQRCQVKRIEHL